MRLDDPTTDPTIDPTTNMTARGVGAGPHEAGPGGAGEPERTFDLVVVGAGLAGLTAALAAARGGARVVVLDGRPPGGRAGVTVVDPGVVFNSGPRALYAGGPAKRILSSFGIEPSGDAPPTSGHAVLDGHVHPIPDSPLGMLRTRLLSAGSKVRAGALLGGLQRIDPARYDDCTVARWLEDRRLAEDARMLVRAVIRTTTYVGDVDAFSAGTAIRQLQLGLGDGVVYLDGGFQQLVDALLAKLAEAGVEVVTGAHVRALEAAPGNAPDGARWRVRTGAADRHGSELFARTAIVATGGPDAVRSVLPVPIDTDGLGDAATAACLELAVRRPPARRFLMGLDEPLYLSVHSPYADLAPPGIQVVHVMRYGARSSDVDRPQLWAHAAAAGIEQGDAVVHRFLRRMVVTGGIPIAAAGGAAGRPDVSVDGAEGLFIAGDWVGPVGLLADAAVASGERAGVLAARAALAMRPSTTS